MIDTPERRQRRSEFIRGLVQGQSQRPCIDRRRQGPPRTIVQFWHDLDELPEDVRDCIASWVRFEQSGFTHRLFDENSAKAFIRTSFDARHERAFERCYHPSMKADYFRLCFMLAEGGFYVDADDVCLTSKIECLFEDSRLRIQPLCYDIASSGMVNPSKFLQPDAYSAGWIFYFNNNPLIATRGHPIIERALKNATDRLELASADTLPEIQATTGPGNLTEAIFEHSAISENLGDDLVVLHDWDSIALSKWPLSYRDDARNWRHSNQQAFRLTNKPTQ